MTKTQKLFQIAKQAAICVNGRKDKRKYRIGAAAIRHDGVIVQARNISTQRPTPTAHAEYRLTRKLDWGAIVYVVRVLSNGDLSMAKPCQKCMSKMKRHGVLRCYYSITDNEYGVVIL